MSNWELLITAVALSMDAFAVSVCKGLATDKVKLKHSLITGAWFGGFQALMPLVGFLFASLFSAYITQIDHWVAFVLLCFIGISMIRESFKKEQQSEQSNPFSVKTMLVMAIATSIDALAVGITFAFLNANIWIAIILIGAITFILSAIGTKLGNVFGAKNKGIAELIGGIVLILLGVKILLEHLGIINF